jgi:hypothetical protein
MPLPHPSLRTAREKRVPKSLDPGLDRKLLAYASAASAAGVGILALARPSQAEVVYTPSNTKILANSTVNLDVNGDGVVDFTVTAFWECLECRPSNFPTGTGFSAGYMRIAAAQAGNKVIVSNAGYVSALRPGASVGSADKFESVSPRFLECLYGRCSGMWQRKGNNPPPATGYVGLEFSINGETHYGWARFLVHHSASKVTGRLAGYAYETVANMPIIAGKTSGTDEQTGHESAPAGTLGSLAAGAGVGR